MGNDEAYDPWTTKHRSELVLQEIHPTTQIPKTQVGSKFGWEDKTDVDEFIDTWDSDKPVIWQGDLDLEPYPFPENVPPFHSQNEPKKDQEYFYPSVYSDPLCGPSPWVKTGDVIVPREDFVLDSFTDAVIEAPKYVPLDPDHVFVNEAICGGPNHPSNTKPSNPKDSVGIAKVPFSTVSAVVWAEVGLAMMEGARKYGRHNYREVGVLASVYYDATLRHLTDWYEGQDTDPASGLSHITKAIASLTVLRDSMIRENWVDDRPPAVKDGWMDELNAKAKEIIEKYPNPVPAFTNKERLYNGNND